MKKQTFIRSKFATVLAVLLLLSFIADISAEKIEWMAVAGTGISSFDVGGGGIYNFTVQGFNAGAAVEFQISQLFAAKLKMRINYMASGRREIVAWGMNRYERITVLEAAADAVLNFALTSETTIFLDAGLKPALIVSAEYEEIAWVPAESIHNSKGKLNVNIFLPGIEFELGIKQNIGQGRFVAGACGSIYFNVNKEFGTIKTYELFAGYEF